MRKSTMRQIVKILGKFNGILSCSRYKYIRDVKREGLYLENIFIWLYPLVTVISIAGFTPQIITLMKTKTDCRDLSLSTWLIWSFGNTVTLGYALVQINDFMFTLTSTVNLFLTVIITGFIIYRRLEWKNQEGAIAVAAE